MDFSVFKSGLWISDQTYVGFRDFRPDSSVFTLKFKDFRDFTPDLRYLRSDFKDYRNFRECRGMSEISDWISEHLYTGFQK